jgi:hypothetical protein
MSQALQSRGTGEESIGRRSETLIWRRSDNVDPFSCDPGEVDEIASDTPRQRQERVA